MDYNTLANIVSRYYTPKIDMNTFIHNLIEAAEIDYLRDNDNSLYTNDKLNIHVFESWLSTKSLDKYDKE